MQPRLNKTGRTRGKIFKLVRRFAGEHENFTAVDVRTVTVTQAKGALQKLAKNGEVAVVRRGRNGFFTIYSPTPHLRDPELTNRWL